MWIFLVLMTIANLGGTKRVRKEPRQISVVSTGEESGSELDPKLCMLRTCKRVMTSVASIGATVARENTQSTSFQPAQEESVSRTTSKTTERPLSQNMDSFPNSGDTATRQSGSAEDTQRSSIPLVGEGNVSNTTDNMESQTEHSHAPIYFATEDGIVMRKFCAMEFHTWEKVPKENKEEMIDRLRKYVDQMKNNREKLVISSRGGSRSIANHKFSMKNKETQLPPTPIKLYHKLHFHPTKEWLNDETRIQYENILQMKEDECTKLVSAGASSGPIMRKKDLHILSAAEPSQSASTDEMALKNKVTALEEEIRENKEKVKQSEEKCEKMLQFMISKFPDSQNILCPPDKEGFRAYDDMTNTSDEE
ncbi:unnamed protein product [Lactuca virosa]|uniref:Uncharacterized protein n=1 Tax=Lactuca virosa TaxID=75947 RepID=A0AAU9LXA7_9ASTR|nr:unnamed protein product [Lactuca virosa]